MDNHRIKLHYSFPYLCNGVGDDDTSQLEVNITNEVLTSLTRVKWKG